MKRLLLLLSLLASPALAGERVIVNPDVDGDIKLKVNDGGVIKDAVKVTGSTGLVTLGATGETGTHSVNGGLTSTHPYLAPAGAVGEPSHSFTTDPDTGVWRAAANALGLAVGGQDTVRITTSGILFSRASASAGPALTSQRSMGTDLATPSVVTNGSSVLSLSAQGYSGAAGTYLTAASIIMSIDGTPDSGGDTTDMPGKIEFRTSPEGSSTPVTAVTIEDNGDTSVLDKLVVGTVDGVLGNLESVSGLDIDITRAAGGQVRVFRSSTAGTATTIFQVLEPGTSAANLVVYPEAAVSGTSGQVYVAGGTAAYPGLAVGDSTMGFYRPSSNIMGVSVAGVLKAQFDTGGLDIASGNNLNVNSGNVVVTGRVFASSGLVGTPGFAFHDDAGDNTGMYRSAEDQLSLATAGTRRLTIGSTGNVEVVVGNVALSADADITQDGSAMTLQRATSTTTCDTACGGTGKVCGVAVNVAGGVLTCGSAISATKACICLD